jgi:hypothetical protein
MNRIAALLSSVVLLCAAVPAISEWQYAVPTPAHGNAAAAVGTKAYVFGGDD